MSSDARVHGVLRKIDRYYTGRLQEHGATPRGVDWNSAESQTIRFAQLIRLLEIDAPTIIDYGCGYGAFSEYVLKRLPGASVTGFDVSEAMIQSASSIYASEPRTTFTTNALTLNRSDYVVASGIFSVKMDVDTMEWERYIESTIDHIASLAVRGFAFNMLTQYSDKERMRPDLYYADPHRLFDLCRTRYSRQVALLHDYGLYEFTIHVRL